MNRTPKPFTYAVYDSYRKYLGEGEAPTKRAAFDAACEMARDKGGTQWIIWRPDGSPLKSLSPALRVTA